METVFGFVLVVVVVAGLIAYARKARSDRASGSGGRYDDSNKDKA